MSLFIECVALITVVVYELSHSHEWTARSGVVLEYTSIVMRYQSQINSSSHTFAYSKTMTPH